MSESILNCYDSHTHFLATGQIASELSLKNLKSAEEIRHVAIEKKHYRGNWVVGFGWNNNQWESSELPTKKILDELFPDTPVFLSRVDGHASWINSKAIAVLESQGYNFRADPLGGKIERDRNGEPTGLLFDQAHIQALIRLPDFTDVQIEQFLIDAAQLFNRGGFTHVRDMSMTFRQWEIQKKLGQQKKINIYCEGFITVESIADLERGFEDYKKCLASVHTRLKIKGLKIFIDGSLGSKTAYLSQNYVGQKQRGLLIWSAVDIKTAIAFCWRNKIEIAIHTIGDEAVHIAAQSAREVSAAGLLGKLHLEHVQLLRPETLQLLKPLHVYIHMQPCHWLSDHTWLLSSIGDLTKFLFQWEQLRRNKIHVDFGSDSPIEPTDLLRNRRALMESAKKGIPALTDDWKKFHSYITPNWGQGRTEFDDENILRVELDGEIIFSGS